MSAATLYCTAANGKPFALARATEKTPCCHVSMRIKEKVTFTCEGSGELLVVGFVRKEQEGLATATPALEVATRMQSPKVMAEAQTATAPSAASAAKATVSAEPAPPAPRVAEEGALSKSQKKRQKKAAAKAAAAAAKAKAKETPTAAAPIVPVAATQGVKRKAEDEQPVAPVARRTLPSGLMFEVLRAGSGPIALIGKKVQVKYEGRLAKTGQRFDKGSIGFKLGLGEVIRGWDEGVKGMLRGEKRRLLVPARLGYGARGAPPTIPPNANLIFEVELTQC